MKCKEKREENGHEGTRTYRKRRKKFINLDMKGGKRVIYAR